MGWLARRFPKPCANFSRSSPPEEACQKYLASCRWPEGFVCPRCGSRSAYELVKLRRWQCAGCRHQISVTAQTILHNTKMPLTVWFWAAYLMTTDKRGISALLLQRQLGLRRYETAWLLRVLPRLPIVFEPRPSKPYYFCLGCIDRKTAQGHDVSMEAGTGIAIVTGITKHPTVKVAEGVEIGSFTVRPDMQVPAHNYSKDDTSGIILRAYCPRTSISRAKSSFPCLRRNSVARWQSLGSFGSRSSEHRRQSQAAPSPTTKALQILSHPPGAKIEINESYVGETPITVQISLWQAGGFAKATTIRAIPVIGGQYVQSKFFPAKAEVPDRIFFEMNLVEAR